MAPDHKGIFRHQCKKCNNCDEFILESGSIKCAYCDCPPGVHVLEQGLIAGPGLSEVPSFKIVLVGDIEVGKTSIFLRYFKNQFDYSYQPTTSVSIENVVKKLNIPEHAVVSVTIWDLPGREEVDLRKSYYKDVDAGIVVVDVSDKESIELAGSWKKDITNHAIVSKTRIEKTKQGSKVVTEYENADPSSIPILLLGNKMDVVELREIQREQAEQENPNNTTLTDPSSKTDANKTSELIDNSQSVEFTKDDADNAAQDIVMQQRDGEQKEEEEDEKKDLEKDERDEAAQEKRDDDKKLGFLAEQAKQEDKEVVVWRYEEEQEEEVEIPEEVQMLQANAEEYGFVGSVAVSAKHSDGGVHPAIQALIRHLLERKLKDHALKKMAAVEVKRHLRKKKKIKKVNPDEFKPLDKVNIPELDQLFLETNRSLHKVHETNIGHRLAIKQFKRECLEAGLVTTSKCSIEDCIGGLKEELEKQQQELVAQDDGGFVTLAVKGEIIDDEDKSEVLVKIMETFHAEVVVSAKAILTVCPTADSNLAKMDAKIANCYRTIWTNLCKDNSGDGEGTLTTREKKKLQDMVEFNRARIKQSRMTASENLQDVDNIYKKVKAAMLW